MGALLTARVNLPWMQTLIWKGRESSQLRSQGGEQLWEVVKGSYERSVSLQAREALRAARKDDESCQQIKYQAQAENAGDVARVGCRLGGKGRGACIMGPEGQKSGEERGRRANG